MLPDVAHCKKLVAELNENGISNHYIHAAAREDISLEGLHQATKLEKTELGYGLALGIIVGGLAGLSAGLAAVMLPPAGLELDSKLVLITTTVIGTIFGIAVSTLVASDIPNHELNNFQDRIYQGEILLIVDMPSGQIEPVKALIYDHHPEVKIGVLKNPRKPLPGQV
ncbi:DUF1269 domain-containing protein [Candidatus Venteria ishoeyi]|uniref:DUF1269 domain-containing protein n=1 Tax=Candidatus Venteria ishoeyi TaxID=1899563 RepID=A0A1H6FFE1_9GAMM|nr:DUF1269 domain-containing protein [Candidatus Venteria ishoeyi]MDM8544987.1 hypothetical protein [Candidatus Venteria ishoeyi]SEH07755.1 Uncharacterised protein [Candidatus Venteria ishoeyi]